ncbi:hypothetical protein [Paenibacillus mendelii]|uniref:Uncharacterized protein n=1 Tax=Paenibacillus mendelii TaxID=206163 RepID=A0ABV6JAF2_9BACL|nr:hypothetical protein [Paenibacillus mendelii]MCQ6560828.1 hypothetical protein [Paenibacillus mendelii]
MEQIKDNKSQKYAKNQNYADEVIEKNAKKPAQNNASTSVDK